MDHGEVGERLNDDEVRERVLGMWEELNAWTDRLGQPWTPAPDSILAADDKASTAGMKPSPLSWTSIASGTDHLLAAAAYLLNFGPTMFSMQTLLRTAMLGSAQVVWMLSPHDRSTRLERAGRISHDAYLNQLWWVDGIKTPHPETFDAAQLAEVRPRLIELLGGSTSLQVKTTKVIEAAADHVFSSDPRTLTECMAAWRVLSCAAHALPWELNLRTAETSSYVRDGLRGTTTRVSWTNLQAALSVAYAFTETAWRLLDDRSASGQ